MLDIIYVAAPLALEYRILIWNVFISHLLISLPLLVMGSHRTLETCDFPLAEWNEISGKCVSHTPLGPGKSHVNWSQAVFSVATAITDLYLWYSFSKHVFLHIVPLSVMAKGRSSSSRALRRIEPYNRSPHRRSPSRSSRSRHEDRQESPELNQPAREPEQTETPAE